MALPLRDRDLALWLVKECLEDFAEMSQKMGEIAAKIQEYPDWKERT